MNRFDRLLYNSTPNCLYDQSLVPEPTQTELRKARDDAREVIRSGFGRSAKQALNEARLSESQQVLINDADIETAALIVKPKFRTQGSFSYHTQVQPEKMPPLEIDIDDGMFLPMEFIPDGSDPAPKTQCDVVRRIVHAMLQPLCARRDWTLSSKTSCLRVHISESAHLDIAIYAVPNSEFKQLIELAARADHYIGDELRIDETAYKRLDRERMMLATDDGWIPSDPRELEDWFESAILEYGEPVRIYSRLLKVWRDYQDGITRLASIALMYAVVKCYEDGVLDSRTGHDKAIAAIAECLPEILNGPIPNPRVDGAVLDQNWDEDGCRERFIDAAREMEVTLNRCLYEKISLNQFFDTLESAFGTRVPRDPNLITLDGVSNSENALSAPAFLKRDADRKVEDAVRKIRDRGDTSRPYFK